MAALKRGGHRPAAPGLPHMPLQRHAPHAAAHERRDDRHAKPAPAYRLPRWQRLALHASGWSLWVTGVLWLAVHYSIGAGAGELPHPAEAWAMRLHGLAAFAGLFVLGALAGSHIPRGWRISATLHNPGSHHRPIRTHAKRWAWQRITGIALCSLAGVLVATGYLLYYFAPDIIRPALGWVHAGVGTVMAAVVWSHRRGRSRQSHDAR